MIKFWRHLTLISDLENYFRIFKNRNCTQRGNYCRQDLLQFYTVMYLNTFYESQWWQVHISQTGGGSAQVCAQVEHILITFCPVASQERTVGGQSRVTPSRGWYPNESLNIFPAEFTRILDKRSLGETDRVGVVTITKKVINFEDDD